MSNRKRFKTHRGLATITNSTPTTVIPAQSGIAPAMLQVAIHNRGSDLRSLRMDVGQEEFFTLSIGASGTIIWDMPDQEEIPAGSGFSAWVNDGYLQPANISVMARYVRYDDRQPNNLNPATYVPSTTHTPNKQGNQ